MAVNFSDSKAGSSKQTNNNNSTEVKLDTTPMNPDEFENQVNNMNDRLVDNNFEDDEMYLMSLYDDQSGYFLTLYFYF